MTIVSIAFRPLSSSLKIEIVVCVRARKFTSKITVTRSIFGEIRESHKFLHARPKVSYQYVVIIRY